MVVLGREGTEGTGGELKVRKKSLASLSLVACCDWLSPGVVVVVGAELLAGGWSVWVNMGLGMSVAVDLCVQACRARVGDT